MRVTHRKDPIKALFGGDISNLIFRKVHQLYLSDVNKEFHALIISRPSYLLEDCGVVLLCKVRGIWGFAFGCRSSFYKNRIVRTWNKITYRRIQQTLQYDY